MSHESDPVRRNRFSPETEPPKSGMTSDDHAAMAAAMAELQVLASAVFPSGFADLEHLTWKEPRNVAKAAPSEHETTEAKLRAAEARFRTLVEQIPAVTFMAVLGEGKNEIYVSPHIEQMLGFTQEEWLGDPFLWYGQLHPDDRPLWNEEFARGCRTGGPFRAECRFLARDGRVVWVHGEARLVKDELGRPMFLQGVAFDITESKQAQEMLLSRAVKDAKHEEELAIAQRVQTMILPRAFDVEGLSIAAAMEPADEVGGDYYDVRPFDGGAWIAIGDVSGHGLDAGLVMLMVQSGLASAQRAYPEGSPREILGIVNEVLVDNIRTRLRNDDHVTLSLLRYTRNGGVTFAGAHEEMLLCRARSRKVERIPTPGTWLGARRGIERFLRDSMITLKDGDLLVLYTDGVTEAMNATNEQFDIDRLAKVIEKNQDESPERVRDAILAAVHAFMKKQFDDISLVVIRYRE